MTQNAQSTQFKYIITVRRNQAYYLYDREHHRFIGNYSMPVKQLNQFENKIKKYSFTPLYDSKRQIYFRTQAAAYFACIILTGAKYSLPSKVNKARIIEKLNIKIESRKKANEPQREYYFSLLGMNNPDYQHPISGAALNNILSYMSIPETYCQLLEDNKIKYIIKGTLNQHHPEHLYAFKTEQEARKSMEIFIDLILSTKELLQHYKIYAYMLSGEHNMVIA